MSLTRRHAAAIIAAAGLAPACAGPASAAKAAEAAFAKLEAEALEAMARQSPVFATWLGDHRFDGLLDDVSAAGRTAAAASRADLQKSLSAIDRAQLPAGAQIDAAILSDHLALQAWRDEAETHAWDALSANEVAGGALYGLISRDFAPLHQRLNAIASRMEALPGLFAAARADLKPERVPKPHAETLARQHPGVMSLVDSAILTQADALGPADRARLLGAAEALRVAAEAHGRWIAETLLPNARGDVRLGADRFDAKLKLALGSALSRAEIKARATAAMERTRAEMAELAARALGKGAPANPQEAIKAALEKAYAERPARANVVAVARETLDASTRFAREKALITLPDAPVEIIIMPEFQRGVAVAYCDSPGPLDRNQKTFYAVSPIPDDWTDAQTTSFLREYNTRSLHELTIHEAMPGHYVQLWHANRYKSILRAALYSGAFVEGWACYAQDMMGEEGYYAGDPLGDLINRKWRLRLISNALLDQGIHVDGMTREEAMRLMVDGAFQEEREAAGKWVRAQVSSTQLSTYFVGWTEHYGLRDRLKTHWKESFSLRRYHDGILAFGSPPTRHVEALLMGEPITPT
jgi:uncharacterized protein (DUF885 family)